MPVDKDYYDILGIRPVAQQSEIELAFNGRRTQYHPDKYADADTETQCWATGKMQEVNEAYQTLIDDDKRRAYDAKRLPQTTSRDVGFRPTINDRMGWSTYFGRDSENRGARNSDYGASLKERLARIERQLREDIAAVVELLRDGSNAETEEFEEFVLLPLEESTEVVIRHLKYFEFARQDQDPRESAAIAQWLSFLLSAYSISISPPVLIDGLGESYFLIQEFLKLNLEECMNRCRQSDGILHQIMSGDDNEFIDIFNLIFSTPDDRAAPEMRRVRESMLSGLLEVSFFGVSPTIASSILHDIKLVNRKWIEKIT